GCASACSEARSGWTPSFAPWPANPHFLSFAVPAPTSGWAESANRRIPRAADRAAPRRCVRVFFRGERSEDVYRSWLILLAVLCSGGSSRFQACSERAHGGVDIAGPERNDDVARPYELLENGGDVGLGRYVTRIVMAMLANGLHEPFGMDAGDRGLAG